MNMISMPHSSVKLTVSPITRSSKRRQSESPFGNFHDAPMIVINKVEKEDTSKQMYSSIGFSERAQDGYMEILQTLT